MKNGTIFFVCSIARIFYYASPFGNQTIVRTMRKLTMNTRPFPSAPAAIISPPSRRAASLQSLRDVYFRNGSTKQEWQGCYESIEQVEP